MPPKRKREAEAAPDDIERFDCDARFATTVAYGPLVFITGQVGAGATIGASPTLLRSRNATSDAV